MRLSKSVIIAIFFLLNVFTLRGIESKGIKLGLNLTSLNDQNNVDAQISPNISLGFFLNQKISNHISFQPEIYLAFRKINFDGQMEQNIDNDGDGQIDEDPFDLIDNDGDGLIDEDRIELFHQGDGQLQSTSIEVPLLLKFLLKNSNQNTCSLLLGPSLTFFLEHSFELYGNRRFKGDIKKDNFAFDGSLGLEVTHKNFIFELGFSESLLKNKWNLKSDDYSVYQDMECGFFKVIKSRTVSLSFLTGFTF